MSRGSGSLAPLPDTIVLFRLGDFYETFDDDAKTVSNVCNIVLTSREMGKDNRVPLTGVPYHAVETYLAKLVQAGHKVAIVEQLETQPEGLKSPGFPSITREVGYVVAPCKTVFEDPGNVSGVSARKTNSKQF